MVATHTRHCQRALTACPIYVVYVSTSRYGGASQGDAWISFDEVVKAAIELAFGSHDVTLINTVHLRPAHAEMVLSVVNTLLEKPLLIVPLPL